MSQENKTKTKTKNTRELGLKKVNGCGRRRKEQLLGRDRKEKGGRVGNLGRMEPLRSQETRNQNWSWEVSLSRRRRRHPHTDGGR